MDDGIVAIDAAGIILYCNHAVESLCPQTSANLVGQPIEALLPPRYRQIHRHHLAGFGLAAGDHAAIIWPLLCGMAKAKYHLMLCEPVNGVQAEAMGLVSLVEDDDKVQQKALEVATRLANGAPSAIRFTKYALNNWLRQAGPIFDASLAMEMMGFAGPDVKEGVASYREKRQPVFNQKCPI